MTERDFRTVLNKMHASGLSWRAVKDQLCPAVPAGTLAMIASGKRHIPAKWIDYLHITRAPRRKHSARVVALHDLPKRELIRALNERRPM